MLRLTGGLVRGLLVAAAVTGSCQIAWADACEPAHDPSPGTDTGTSITFFNDTPYAYRIYWADFDGFLVEYGLLQPFEQAGFQTYVGHAWYVEAYAPEGTSCLGPISAPDTNGCSMHILYNDGFGYDGGFCDFY